MYTLLIYLSNHRHEIHVNIIGESGGADNSLGRTGRKLLTGHLQCRRKWLTLGFQSVDHPPYSPDLVRLDYHLLPGLKKN
jgi:hypothetical protein